MAYAAITSDLQDSVSAPGVHVVHESDLDFENTDTTIQKIILEALSAVRNHFSMDYAFLSEFSNGQRLFKGVSSKFSEPVICAGEGGSLEDSYCQRVVDGRLPELIPDATQEPEALKIDATTSLPVGAHLSTPIRFQDGHVYGTFCCFSHKPNYDLDERDLGVLKLFADFVSIQLERFVKRKDRMARAAAQVQDVIDKEDFEIYFQPIIDLTSGMLAGYEALTRFSAKPYKTPDVWFNQAANVNLGIELELITLRRAVSHMDDLPDDVYVSLNVSPEIVLHERFDSFLADAPLERIALEVTEHLAIVDYTEIVSKFQRLRAQGIKIFVDDAGAGYASFRHILEIDPDTIKLDRSIIAGIDKCPSNRALAAAVVKYAHETNTETVAEGVETQQELDVLKQLGVNKVQGYLLGRPIQAQEFSVLES